MPLGKIKKLVARQGFWFIQTDSGTIFSSITRPSPIRDSTTCPKDSRWNTPSNKANRPRARVRELVPWSPPSRRRSPRSCSRFRRLRISEARAHFRVRRADISVMPRAIRLGESHRSGLVPILGAHMSIAGGYYRAVESAHECGCDCVQMFTKNNNQWRAKELTDEDAELFQRGAGAARDQASDRPRFVSDQPGQPGRRRCGKSRSRPSCVELLRAERLGIPLRRHASRRVHHQLAKRTASSAIAAALDAVAPPTCAA